MILKNENATIHETLTSIREGIDYWTIVDTGSTGTSRSCSSAYPLIQGLASQNLDFQPWTQILI